MLRRQFALWRQYRVSKNQAIKYNLKPIIGGGVKQIKQESKTIDKLHQNLKKELDIVNILKSIRELKGHIHLANESHKHSLLRFSKSYFVSQILSDSSILNNNEIDSYLESLNNPYPLNSLAPELSPYEHIIQELSQNPYAKTNQRMLSDILGVEPPEPNFPHLTLPEI